MSKVRDFAEIISAGIAADDAGLGNVTNESKATMFTSPTFTGTPTGITAAHLEAGVLPSDVTGGSGLTALGTVASGTLEDAVTYRNIDQDLASTDSPTFNNLSVSQIEGSTHYRSNFVSIFPYHTAHAITVGIGGTWTYVCSINGQWSTGNSHLEEWMTAPGAGFTEAFYLTIVGGTGSGSGILNFRLKQNGTTNYGIASTHVVQGWHGYAAQFVKTVAIGTFNGVTLRNLLNTGSNNSAEVEINNTGSTGYTGCSRVLLEQRIYFS
jgi:hypothetical protein